MSVTNKRWDGQTITPKHDSIQFDNGQNGIIHGCEITHLGSNILRIAEGYMIICGRLIEVDQTDINCEVSSSGTLNGQMIIRLNLGAVQSIDILTEAAGELTELTQDADANYDNGIYEIQLATYNVNETTISNLEVTAPTIEKLGDKVAAVESDIDELNQNLNALTDVIIKTKKIKKTMRVTKPKGLLATWSELGLEFSQIYGVHGSILYNNETLFILPNPPLSSNGDYDNGYSISIRCEADGIYIYTGASSWEGEYRIIVEYVD